MTVTGTYTIFARFAYLYYRKNKSIFVSNIFLRSFGNHLFLSWRPDQTIDIGVHFILSEFNYWHTDRLRDWTTFMQVYLFENAHCQNHLHIVPLNIFINGGWIFYISSSIAYCFLDYFDKWFYPITSGQYNAKSYKESFNSVTHLYTSTLLLNHNHIVLYNTAERYVSLKVILEVVIRSPVELNGLSCQKLINGLHALFVFRLQKSILPTILTWTCGYLTFSACSNCDYKGNLYRPGDTWVAADDCNVCTCKGDGTISCETKNCTRGMYTDIYHLTWTFCLI